MSGNILEPGAKAPAFELKDLTGRVLSLAEVTNGKPALIAFMKVSCPVCQMTFPFLERMASSQDLNIIGVSQDHLGATQSFNSKFGVTFRTLLDEENAGYPASNAFGISHVPTAFLVESDGEISMVMEGFAKSMMTEIGDRAGVSPFRPGDFVPEWKSG